MVDEPTLKGIKKPVVSWQRNEQALEMVKGHTLTYESTLEVCVDDFETVINKKYYSITSQSSESISV
jgi:hypothetical protein